jgi:hypothetical protein
MSVVQPLLITGVIFALGLRLVWLRQSIRGVTWSAAAVTCLSLGVFLAAAEPQGGSPYPASHVWAAAAGTTVGAAAVLALLGMRGPPGQRSGTPAEPGQQHGLGVRIAGHRWPRGDRARAAVGVLHRIEPACAGRDERGVQALVCADGAG